MYETSKIHENSRKRQKRSPGSSILFLIWQNMVLRCTTVLHIWKELLEKEGFIVERDIGWYENCFVGNLRKRKTSDRYSGRV